MTKPALSSDDELEKLLTRLCISYDHGHDLPEISYELLTIPEAKEQLIAWRDKYAAVAADRAREIFIPVKDYEGLYEVSNLGNVRSVKGGRRSGKLLSQATVLYGYKKLSFCSNSVVKNQFVHRLVARAFLSNPENKPCVNHIDGNPSNNNVSNLEWATYSENEKHSFSMLGKVNGQSKFKAEQIKEIMDSPLSTRKLATQYNVSQSVIQQIKAGESYKFIQKQLTAKLNESEE